MSWAAVRGFLITLISATVAATFITIVAVWISEPDPPWQALFMMGAAVFSYCVVIAFAAMLLVCIPLTLFLSSMAVERAWIYSLFGFVTGAAAARAFAILDWVITGGLPGALAGWFWWLSYRKHAALEHSA